jgi:quercetin dioxygenase-like cupin family protein
VEDSLDFIDFTNYIFSTECFENNDVSYIDKEGKQHYLDEIDFFTYQATIAKLLVSKDSIKIEQAESLFKYENGTAHIFFNKPNGYSFPVHTDPVDVLIECLDGKKWLEIDGIEVCLEKGNSVLIPSNTPHRALNNEKALIVSYGISDTETLTRIR